MANVNLTRSAEINYTARAGDTFAPPPVSFTIDAVAEIFTSCTIKLQVRSEVNLVKELNIGSGIEVSSNALQYSISAADMANIVAGKYKYDVQKTDGSGIISTIQHGTITIIKDITR